MTLNLVGAGFLHLSCFMFSSLRKHKKQLHLFLSSSSIIPSFCMTSYTLSNLVLSSDEILLMSDFNMCVENNCFKSMIGLNWLLSKRQRAHSLIEQCFLGNPRLSDHFSTTVVDYITQVKLFQ